MELRHLRYFVTIAEEQSFRRAATRLHVSQSPLSRQMKDLEEEMGVALFEPAGRGIKLTAAGRLFAERAQGILASVDAAVDEAKGVAEGKLGTVVIGFETGATFMGVLSSLVAAFRKRTPRVGLQLVPLSSVEQWTALRQGTIAFGYGAYAPSDDALSYLEMSRDRLGLLLSREHRLSRLAKIRLRDLESERVLLQPRQLYPSLHADIITAARAQGVTLRGTAEVLDLEALLALVVIGDAVTFLAEKASDLVPPTSAVWRPVEDLHINLSEFVTWRAKEADAPVVRALIESAREVGPRLQPAAGRPRSSSTTHRNRRHKR
ncbi:LysR family transcriptional regulator [Chondromyces apiculatus]|uniref:LysR family transcriptional regulator YnfL n=1 Tax=Chondromyces apiculatus DSM 436 TaxID=1192034 RepID=A0A017TEB7_9BACT|nr:LysR family transcriptional regulator [Chondromyces apiculatus]EYF07272.1 LysR family transcriptional regulator YnfL [Chondromyces apiculatus DSM 436]